MSISFLLFINRAIYLAVYVIDELSGLDLERKRLDFRHKQI